MELKAGRLADAKTQLVLTGTNSSCLDFTGTFSGCQGRLKMDSGASHGFINASFVSKAGLAVTPCARAVALANGKVVQVIGSCKVRLQIGRFTDVVHFYVLRLGAEYDAILGADWLLKHSAVLDFGSGTLTLKKGNHTITGRPAAWTADPQDNKAPAKEHLSALQMKRAVRKGANLFMVQVQKVEEDKQQHAQAATAAPIPEKGMVPDAQLKSILDKYKCVFEDMPGGNIERPGIHPMRIELEAGKVPPVGISYRLSHPEYLECERLIKEGLEKGLIETSSSLWRTGAFCAKAKRRWITDVL